ncbi:uncharacterized protein LOC143916070 [Arctopsyche grandis]|uniref:uncharacterized protein LOC143916070 n=1 Tax=Arctopsyche grandis TaxID=121162 RepID=UPI00406D794A
MSSLKPDQVNRVKSITSKFEDLNGQASTQPAKSNVTRDLPVQKANFGRLKNDPCCENHLPSNRVLNGNNNAKDKFGPSCNFGNRKRLKDQNDKEILKNSNEKLNSNYGFSVGDALRTHRVNNGKSFDFSAINNNLETSDCPNSKILSRQFSDPVKKLQRTPAFRCDRSEKIRDSNRSSLSESPESQKQSERFNGREKLKKLGSMIEERLREDNLTFSGMTSKVFVDCSDKLDNNCNEGRIGFDTTNIIDSTKKNSNNGEPEQIVGSIVEDSLDEAFVAEMKRSDSSIPQHVLDMYAKVLKPKTRCGIFSKSDFLSKSDAVFSDSGVSSESENLISDDLDDSRICNDNVFANEDIIEKESAEVDPLLRSNTQNLSSSSNDDTQSLDEFVALNGKSAIISGVASIDTLKKVLQQPLPPGPPPKKPPRIFASTSSSPVSPKKTLSKVPSKIQIDSRFKLKSPNNKTKPHRSKEESKLMLDKIESALIKHKNGGKVLSPRLDANRAYEPVTFFNDRVQTTVGDSISTTSTQPSTVRLRQESKKVDKGNATDKKPEEIHYMCTEILDLHFSDKNGTANLSNDSITSEIVQPSSSFVNCFNSLNCVGGKDKNYSIFYSKFGSAPNSTNTSFVDVCCYCNLKEKKCQNGNGHSDSGVRLSTFFNPNKSLDRTESEKCKRCCINEMKETNFKCHLDCKCTAGETSENGIGNSSFFVREIPGDTGQYGALVKSKSQEHIYDEPANVIKDLDEIKSRNHEDCMKRSMFTRSATQLEDSFNRFRARSMIENTQSDASNHSNTLNRFVRNEFKSKTMDRVKSDSRDCKVKDILKLVEFNIKNKSYAKRTSAADEIDNKPDKSGEKENGDKSQLFKKTKQLHYMCSNIYDTTPAETSPLFGRNSSERSIAEAVFEPEINSSSHITKNRPENKRNSADMSPSSDKIIPNASALYNKHISKEILQRLNKDSNMAVKDEGLSIKKPPIFEKKIKDLPSTIRRPQNFDVRGETFNVFLPKMRGVIGPKNETDKRNLDQLMTEIYDTVTAVCMVESPTKEGNMLPDEFNKNADVTTSIYHDKEMTEASLKLSRSLTEKRKKYVRRVSSRTGLIAPISVGSVKRNRQSLDVYENRTSDDITLSLPIKYDFKKVKALFEQDVPIKEVPIPNKVVEIEQNIVKRQIVHDKDRLFEVCALIGMNFSTGQAYIKSVYPENAMLPPQIESLVFPESLDCNEENVELLKNSRKYERVRLEIPPEYTQCYSLVLTDERGNRNYGYCRRVVPEGETFCLPLAYCIISPHRIPYFYHKVLNEIEMHYGSSEVVVRSILDQLYNEKLPHPGNCISFKQIKTPKKLGSFKKNTISRSTVNLGDVFKKASNNGRNVSNIGAQRNQSDSLENLSQIKFNSNNSLRRKSADLSLKFPDVFAGENGKQVLKSLEKMCAEDFKDYQEGLKTEGGFYSELKRSTLNVDENCFEREFGSKNNLTQGILSHPLNLNNSNLRKSPVEKRLNDCDRIEYYEDPIELKRPLELRLEEDNLSILFDCISVDLLVKIFGTLLLERKVIIVGDKLSQLSSCIEALQSILYPFIWQHTLISTIPSYLRRDLLDTPMPILAGVLCTKSPSANVKRKKSNSDKHSGKASPPKLGQPSDASSNFYISDSNEVGFNLDDFYDEIKSSNFEEGMIIDITSNNNMPSDRVIKVQDDESTLLPPVLAKKLRAALQLGPILNGDAQSESHARKSRNILIAETFLRFFVDLLGDYRAYLTIESSSNSAFHNDGDVKKQNFDKENYIKSASTKHVQFFLEWFTETAMFSNFINCKSQIEVQERLPYPSFYHLFDERIYLLESTKTQTADSTSKNGKHEPGSNIKNNYKLKLKTWRDKLRDLIN